MSRRKKQYVPKTFESSKGLGDTSANIYLSMLLSEAWQDLNDHDRVVYLNMKSQYYGQKTVREYDPVEEEKKEYEQTCFYFNRGLARDKFGIKNPTQFIKSVKSLISHGFIKIAKGGRNTRSKSIYEFSSEWQNWTISEEDQKKKEERKAIYEKNRNNRKAQKVNTAVSN